MALATNTLPYGLRDVKLKPIDDAGTVGAAVDLPAAQTFSFSEAEDYEELRGDDGVVAVRGKGPKVEWTLESGGVSLAAYVIIAGGTLTLTGVTPNQIQKVRKLGTDTRPYFQAEGQAISDSGGDFHGVVFKCRTTGNVEGEMADGSFWISKAEGEGIPNLNGYLYDLVHNETATAIV